jgi:hypothetical protein
MSSTEWVPSLATLALGWILNELSQRFSARRDDKKAIARALSNLLEIRHELLAIPKVIEFISRDIQLPAEVHAPLKAFISQWIPSDASLRTRYEESINLVAAANPVLAFRLRSQDQSLPFLNRLRQVAPNDPMISTVVSALEHELMNVLPAHLDELIKEVAWMHGWRTRLSVQKTLKRRFEFPKGISKLLKTTVASLQDAQKAETQQKQAPV